MALKENQLKAQIKKVRDEKQNTEKQLFETEFIVGERDKEIQNLKSEFKSHREQKDKDIAELEGKVAWFRDN